MDGCTDAVARAWSAEEFGAAAGEWQRLLTEHLREVMAGRTKVLNWSDPQQSAQAAAAWLEHPLAAGPDGVAGGMRQLLQQMLSAGQNLHHPHYIGHQVPASSPLAGLLDGAAAITNQVMAVYEMGPWATAVEQALVSRLCGLTGWDPSTSSGILTHGGSLANLTALLTARNVVLPQSWRDGVPAGTTMVANADVHYCITRAAGILGLGAAAVQKVPLDARRRMDVQRLDDVLIELRRGNRPVIAVSACAGATPTGAIDDLSAVADVCRRHEVWMHVDAAHGGSLLFSRRYRDRLKGIAAADSVIWDAHKMLFVPALCTAVLYRRREVRFETFQQDAPYLFDPSAPGMADIDVGMRTVECTKRATGFGLWGLWALFGAELFEQLVDRMLQLTMRFRELLNSEADFEALHEPECNILAFRHLPAEVRLLSLAEQNRFQRELRTQLIREGSFYIVQTTLDGMAALRATVINPLTTEQDLRDLLTAVRQCGQRVWNL